MSNRKLELGSTVIFINPRRQERVALVTAIWGDNQGRSGAHGSGEYCSGEVDEEKLMATKAEFEEKYPERKGDFDIGEPGSDWPCINLVFVTGEESKTDQYGRQIDRETSVVHVSNNSAEANCYRFLED